jgi:uncharacterized protein YqeY
MRAKTKASQEEMKAAMRASQERMKAAICAIQYAAIKSEETISNQVEGL